MSWQPYPYDSPVLPVHAVLLYTGKVLFFSGSGTDPNETDCPDCSVVWNPSNNTFTRPKTPLGTDGLPLDLFCSGHSFRANGHVLVAGGTLRYNPYRGSLAALVFDPSTETWIKTASMARGRWYPTLVTLGNGRIFTVSGLDENSNLNRNPEIYDASNGWRAFSKQSSRLPMYAHLFLLSNGKVFFSGGNFQETDIPSSPNVAPRILTLPSSFGQSITEQAVSGLQNQNQRNQCASVLLPPAQDQKVMIIGGGENHYTGVATNSVYIVDLKASSPTYVPGASLNFARMHHNAVLLPDRTVFVCNGSRVGESSSEATRAAEIYNPVTNTWKTVETASVDRLYHSVALLLSDGSVVSAGSNPVPYREMKLEIYRPAYMLQQRPVIQSAPSQVSLGQTITIQTPQAANIRWVSLLRPMSTTHGLDTDQRLVDLPINARTSTSVTVSVTSNQNLAPLGWYMLFINDQNGAVPSVAHWIKVV